MADIPQCTFGNMNDKCQVFQKPVRLMSNTAIKTLLVVSCVEMVRACPQGPNPVSFSASSGTVLCVITELLLHRVTVEEERNQMLHLGQEDGTDCFRSLFQTKGMGEAESQKSDRVAKGKEERKLQCWRSHHRGGS